MQEGRRSPGRREFLACLSLFLVKLSCRSGGEFLSLGSGPLGGVYYLVGVGLAELLQKRLPQRRVRVIVTGGALENPALLENGEIQLGFTNSHVAYLASQGRPPFPSPARRLAGLFSGLAPGVAQYVVREDSPIRSVRDLIGRRVAAGAQGSTGILVLSDVLEFSGMDLGQVQLSYISPAEGVRSLVDGKIDMAVVQSAVPSPAILEAVAGGHGIRFLQWEKEEERQAFVQRYPYYSPYDLSPSTYRAGLDHPLRLLCTDNMVVVDSRLEAELVYEITRGIFQDLQAFHAIHPSARWLTPQRAVKTPVPLHPGAARYFHEAGFLT